MVHLDLVRAKFIESITVDTSHDGASVTVSSTTTVGKSHVDLQTYILAYEEISKIFAVLGSVFKFVSTDVEKKLSILRSKQQQQPHHYNSLSSMIKYETETNLTTSDSNNGCRTLLRLHRALEFVAEFINALIERKDSSVSGPVWNAYSQTLAKHHTWIIRNTVSMAMYTLPTRQNILLQVGVEEDPECLTPLVKTMREVYEIVQSVYTESALLDLK